MRLAPRFISDYLCLEYREKIRNQLNDSIFRNVIETADFALPSEENIGEAHKQFANTKRATKYTNSNYGIRVFDMSNLYNQSMAKPGRPNRDGSAAQSRKRDASSNHRDDHQAFSKGEGQNSKSANNSNQASASEHEVTPIIFEECYVKNDEFRFVQ